MFYLFWSARNPTKNVNVQKISIEVPKKRIFTVCILRIVLQSREQKNIA